MFTQIFRNRIYENRRLKYRIRNLESFIRLNFHQREEDIVKGFADLWKNQGSIELQPFNFGGTYYQLVVEFYQLMTHGKPYVEVNDKVSINSGQIEYETEFGDLAIIVDYWLEDMLIDRKISILQTKKEKAIDEVDIKLHQQYLMQFWPNVTFPPVTKQASPHTFNFEDAHPDEFSFYQFLLNKSFGQYSSSLCSATFVGEALGLTLPNLQGVLANWSKKRQTNPHQNPPSVTLKMPLSPGSIYHHGAYYKWNLLTKPFTRFLLDAAYLYVGTEKKSIIDLAFHRVPNILAMKVVGGREGKEFRNHHTDIYEHRKQKENY